MNPGSKPIRGRCFGFTLVELLVVLVIVGIMSAMVLPRLTGTLLNLNHKTAVRKVCAALRFTRSQAVSEGVTLTAAIDMDKRRVRIFDTSGNGYDDGVEDAGGEKNEDGYRLVYELPEDVRFEKTEASTEDGEGNVIRIFFYSSGRTSGGNFYITRDRKPPFLIVVDRITGSVSAEG